MVTPKRRTATGRAKARDTSQTKAIPMRTVRFTVPDTSSPEFREQAHLESLLIAQSEQDADDQAFIDSISDVKFE